MNTKDQVTNLMASLFAKNMIVDPYDEYFSREDVEEEKDYTLSVLKLKNCVYSVVSKMMYENFTIEEILMKIDKIISNNIDVSQNIKRRIERRARILVLEQKRNEIKLAQINKLKEENLSDLLKESQEITKQHTRNLV